MWTEIIIVNNQQQEVDVPVPNDPNVGIPYHRFIPNASSIDPICEALFSDRWALNVTNNPDGAAQNPWLTVGGKVYVAGNGQAQLNNGPTFDQNAPNLYVGGKVGIGDRDLFDASQHFAQDDQPRLLVEGDARIQPSKNQNGSLKANFHVVGTTAIEDPEDPSKSNPQFANPLMNIRGSLKIADPGQTPNFQPGNPLVTISGPTVIEKIGPNVKTTLDATALTNLDPQFRVFGNTILEGTTTVIGPLVINGSARVTEDLTVEKTTITKGLRPPGTDTTPTGYIRVNEGNLIVDPNVPTGPTGPAGAAGPTGPTGPTGPRGPAGSAPPPDNDFEGIVTIDGPESRAPALAVDGYAQFSGMISAFGHTEPVMIRVGELNRREAIPSKSGPGKRRKRYGVELNWFDEFVRLELLAHNKYNRDAVLVWGNDIKSRFVLRFNCDDKPPMSHDGTKPYNNEFPDSTIRRPEPGLANAGSDLTTPNKAPAQPKENTKDHVRDIMTVHPTGLIEINGWIRARGYRQYSDMQMKEDIQPISGALDKIQALRGVRYLWAEEESNARDGEDGPHLGFIAQEVEEVLPELVTSDQEQGKCVDYLQMTPLLIEAVKEQQAVIDAQKKQIDALEQKIQAIMSLLSAQKTDS